jgi:hypothetical protein
MIKLARELGEGRTTAVARMSARAIGTVALRLHTGQAVVGTRGAQEVILDPAGILKPVETVLPVTEGGVIASTNSLL